MGINGDFFPLILMWINLLMLMNKNIKHVKQMKNIQFSYLNISFDNHDNSTDFFLIVYQSALRPFAFFVKICQKTGLIISLKRVLEQVLIFPAIMLD